jgi:hypothetical protein
MKRSHDKAMPFRASNGEDYEIRQTSNGREVELRVFKNNAPANQRCYSTPLGRAGECDLATGTNTIDELMRNVKLDVERLTQSNQIVNDAACPPSAPSTTDSELQNTVNNQRHLPDPAICRTDSGGGFPVFSLCMVHNSDGCRHASRLGSLGICLHPERRSFEKDRQVLMPL